MTAIRAYRQAAGDSQAAFAERLGVSLETYRTWDDGRRAPPEAMSAAARRLAELGNDDIDAEDLSDTDLPSTGRGVPAYVREQASIAVNWENRLNVRSSATSRRAGTRP